MSRRKAVATSDTDATGAAIVAATEVAVEADAAEVVRVADEVTPDTAAGAAVVAATEAVAETQAAEAIGTAEAVAAIVSPAEPAAAEAVTDVPPVAGATQDDGLVDLLEPDFTVEDIVAALRHAQSIEPTHIQRLREALALLDAEDLPASSADTGVRDRVTSSDFDGTAASVDWSRRRFRLVSAIVGDKGTVPAGEWVAVTQDEHATLRRGLSVDYDWDGGLPL